jgi:hypothetical protein
VWLSHVNCLLWARFARTFGAIAWAGALVCACLDMSQEVQTRVSSALMMCSVCCRYNVDPQLVQRALVRACLPDIVEAQGPGGVKAFAEWPVWFERRS